MMSDFSPVDKFNLAEITLKNYSGSWVIFMTKGNKIKSINNNYVIKRHKKLIYKETI